MKDVLLRVGMKEGDAMKDRYEAILVKVWDDLLPKVCGSEFWSVTKRHHGNISTHGPPPTVATPYPDPYVHHTSEAMLLWIWENNCNKWWHVLSKGIQSDKPEFKRKVKAIKAKEASTRTQADKKLLAAIHTPYTNAASGQKKFGDWREEGWAAYKNHQKMIKKNREEQAELLKEVEDRVFPMVREKNQRD